eukprot:s2900_g17.t1
MLRTKYTEVYPRKFARSVAQVLAKGDKWWPYHWKPGMRCFAHDRQETVPQPVLAASNRLRPKTPAVRSQFRQKPQFARSELVSPSSRESQGAKRSKSDPLQGSAPTLEMCQDVIQAVNRVLARVGRQEIEHSDIRQSLQNVFPDKKLVCVMSCRGTERTMEPPTHIHAQEAPFRKMLILQRDGEIKYERHWEDWTNLSKRQLVRPSHACRINITVFAWHHVAGGHEVSTKNQEQPSSSMSDKQSSGPEASAEAPSLQPISAKQFEKPMQTVPPEQSMDGPEVTPSKENESDNQPAAAMTKPPNTAEPSGPTPENVPLPSEPRLSQQGYRFKCLPSWEQSAILRMHKNLGHPSNERLSRALQLDGYRPEVTQAALEIRCSTCAASCPPKHSRPATLKPMIDFNDKVYVDGITWSNKAGKTFHFYHLLDAGSNYHVAIVAPSKTSESIINIINQHWISWAGPPNELVVDSGTEMNSEVFGDFLQRFGIKSTTTCPEAHWQSGRIERHGAFLQTMLVKMDIEEPILDYPSLQLSLNQRTHAKNSLSIRHGYAPEIIVFGKHSRIPGSVLSDESRPAHEMAISETPSITQADFKIMLSRRESARRAYHAADNHDVDPNMPPPEDDLEPILDDQQELVQLTCHETANALSCEVMEGTAWRCEFEVPLNQSLSQHTPSKEDSWILLATSAKKQRTEVKLSSLSLAERHEFELAKDSEVQNWIRTSTISAILRHQIPEEQVLRCRWILTWKPLTMWVKKTTPFLPKDP